MADSTDNSGSEPTVHLGLHTPFGVIHVENVAMLPEAIRDTLKVSLYEAEGMPLEVRDALAKALDVDLADLSDRAESAAPGEAVTEDGHAPGCTCTEQHRAHVWELLDGAFPNDSHVWQAAEALFTLSAINPDEVDAAGRRASLEKAALHIQRAIELSAPPLSPVDQLIEQFRSEMNP